MIGEKRIPRRPLKILLFIVYILIVLGLLYSDLNIGFKLVFSGVILFIIVISYILITRIS